MQRRTFLTLSAATAASAAFPFKARATVPKPQLGRLAANE
jgi:hypothetical protein